jgi:hypothetical protein
VGPAAQAFLAALLHDLFPHRPIVVVTEGLRSQESAQQDLATWLALGAHASKQDAEGGASKPTSPVPEPSALNPQPLFYPAWDILSHDARLPHADVISERLETLVALAALSRIGKPESVAPPHAPRSTLHAPLVVTSVVALLQRTFPRGVLAERTRVLARGERADPLDFAEWLEDQGYEPEARVTQKGEMALRGGILDVYPLTSPWPVRLEFFGDELESLRYFDPLTQVSREEITAVTIPPAGELGILKQSQNAGVAAGILPAVEGGILPPGPAPEFPSAIRMPTAIPPGRMPGSTAGRMPAATDHRAAAADRCARQRFTRKAAAGHPLIAQPARSFGGRWQTRSAPGAARRRAASRRRGPRSAACAGTTNWPGSADAGETRRVERPSLPLMRALAAGRRRAPDKP